jgi:hypothetical protein
LAPEIEVLGENLPQCQYVYHICNGGVIVYILEFLLLISQVLITGYPELAVFLSPYIQIFGYFHFGLIRSPNIIVVWLKLLLPIQQLPG